MYMNDYYTNWQILKCCGNPEQLPPVLHGRGDIWADSWWINKSWGWGSAPAERAAGLMLESNEHSWNTKEFNLSGEKDVSSSVARAVAREGSRAGSWLLSLQASWEVLIYPEGSGESPKVYKQKNDLIRLVISKDIDTNEGDQLWGHHNY